MRFLARTSAFLALLLCSSIGVVHATTFADAIKIFRNAGASAAFFRNSYAYAVFPAIGKGALGVGGAFGKGRVYLHDRYIGDATMGALSVGFQAGGKAYSEIILFGSAVRTRPWHE